MVTRLSFCISPFPPLFPFLYPFPPSYSSLIFLYFSLSFFPPTAQGLFGVLAGMTLGYLIVLFLCLFFLFMLCGKVHYLDKYSTQNHPLEQLCTKHAMLSLSPTHAYLILAF